jgi:predicted MFS family arabinose efflux permease
MLGGTLPVPLYVLYERQMGFGPLGVTVVFAAYVLGTLFALLALGDLSDHMGRRAVLALAVACAAVSTVLFLAATNIWWLIVARVVSGAAAGLVTGTATAALAELQPRGDRRAAAVVASGGNMTGLGLGPLTAGLFAEYVAMPLHSVFWAYLGICAVALAALLVIPETVRNPDRAISFRPRLAAPPEVRTPLIGSGLGVFAAFTVLGLFSSLVPTFLYGILGVHNLALIGVASFLIFVTAAVSQAVSARMASRRSLEAGLPLLLVTLAALESALFAKALWLFVVGTLAGGVAVGFIFRGGLSELNRLAQPQHRAAVVSTFFVAAYVGLGCQCFSPASSPCPWDRSTRVPGSRAWPRQPSHWPSWWCCGASEPRPHHGPPRTKRGASAREMVFVAVVDASRRCEPALTVVVVAAESWLRLAPLAGPRRDPARQCLACRPTALAHDDFPRSPDGGTTGLHRPDLCRLPQRPGR